MPTDIEILIEEFRAQYLPDGSIELLSFGEKLFDEYCKSGLDIPASNLLLLKREKKQIIVLKLSKNQFVELSSNIESNNLGILKSISNKLLVELKQLPEFSK